MNKQWKQTTDYPESLKKTTALKKGGKL